MKRLILLIMVALLAVCLASLAAADDCGGYRCPPPEYTTPVPTPVLVPSTPTPLPHLLLPYVRK